jgi:hypothetical protein
MTLRGLLFAMLAMLIAALFFFLLPIVGLILAGVLVFATPVLLFLGQVRPTGGILIEGTGEHPEVFRGVLLLGDGVAAKDATVMLRRAG